MKMQLTSNPLITSDEMESSVMGMDSSGMDQACYFLRDKIYSDKVGAVVREYITNALDEHVKYNVDHPVRVSLTNTEFIVRDFAKGLSESDVRNVFGMYFKSTKRDNNIQTGSFGLGSKAAHCYTDAFYVKSYFNGVCTLYTAVLGGGKSGVPVGQIMKISEEPTNESGLEISVEYNDTDRATFVNRILLLVESCSKKIVFNYNEKEHFPCMPVHSIEKNGYSFKLYNYDPSFSAYFSQTIYFKMGEIIYDSRLPCNFLDKTQQELSLPEKSYLVVEIPIGKMSLPISRESFEDTPSNKRVLEDVKKTLLELYNEEFKDKKDLSVDELLKEKDNRAVVGKFFQTSKNALYPFLFQLLSGLNESYSSQPLQTFKDKKIVALIPNKESLKYWIDKFEDHCIENRKNYYYLNESYLNRISDENVLQKLESYFIFKKVKSTIFNWPKNKTEKNISNFTAKITIESSFRYKKTYVGTALQIHNYMRKELSLPIAENEEEAKNQLKNTDWVSDNGKILEYFTISENSSYNAKVKTGSKTMISYLKELGWFIRHSPEYNAIIDEINKRKSEKAKIEIMKETVSLSFLLADDKNKLISKLTKKEKYLQKASNIISRLKEEKSLRGTLFYTMCREGDSYWFSGKQLSRKELRKILLLK